MTAFGSVLADPARAGAVLRARASSAGLSLLPVSAADMCAAVLAAHCWVLATGRTSVGGAMTPQDAQGLAPALARAAGHGSQAAELPGVEWCSTVQELSPSLMAAIAPVVTWALERCGMAPVALAAHDLAVSPSTTLNIVAQHLATCLDVDEAVA